MIERRYKIIVCRGPECGERLGSSAIYAAFHEAIRLRGLEGRAELAWQSCFGRCRQGPNVLVRPVMPGMVVPGHAVPAPAKPGVMPADVTEAPDELAPVPGRTGQA